MSFQIRIEPEVLRTTAERQRNIQKIVEEIKGKLTVQIRALDQAWDGGASMQAINNLESIKNKTDDLVQGVYSGANMLEVVAHAFEALDDNPEGEAGPILQVLHFDINKYVVGCPRPEFSLIISGRLRIIPESVREVGQQCKQISQMSAEAAEELRSALKNLDGSWEGKSFQRYANETEDIISAFKLLTNTLAEFGEKVISIANRYEDLDRRF